MDVLLLCLVFVNLACFLVILLYSFRNYIPSFLHDLFEYGKTKPDQNRDGRLQCLHVPNSWFTHFYVVGSTLSCALIGILIKSCFHGDSSTFHSISHLAPFHGESHIDCFTVLSCLLLLLVQTSRRLFECLFVSIFSGKIHIGHYVGGILFYILDAASLAAPLLSNLSNEGWCASCKHPSTAFTWCQVLGVVVFAWASWHQWNCHIILARLRHSPHNQRTKVYKIPHGDWFEYVSSPHYLAEILIYCSFLLVQKGRSLYVFLILLFTIQNLSLSATVTQKWYTKKFKQYPTSRYRILPLLY